MFEDSPLLMFLAVFVLSFFLCTVTILLLSQFAKVKKVLLDNPTERKRHVGAIPLVGGLAIFVTYSICAPLFSGFGESLGAIFLASLWLMIVGLVDDITELSSVFRLLAQITAALFLIYFADTQIHTLGNLFSGDVFELHSISLIFTVMCILGVINAINMIDGIDGLSGGIALLTISALFIISLSSVSTGVSLLMITLLGSLVAFVLFNTGYYGESRKVFMGDAGSTVLGLLLAWLFITLSQNGERPLSPVTAGWLFGLPLVDSVSVMVRRLLQGQSPFRADRNHLHHQLLDLGLSTRSTLLLMLVIHAIFVIVGLQLNNVPAAEPLLFWTFVGLVIGRHYIFGWKLWRTV